MGETAANNLGSHPGPHEAITGYLHSLFEGTMNAAMSATFFYCAHLWRHSHRCRSINVKAFLCGGLIKIWREMDRL